MSILRLICRPTALTRALRRYAGLLLLLKMWRRHGRLSAVIEGIASAAGVSTEVLCMELAAMLGVPFLPRIPATDVSLWPRGVDYLHARKLGFVPVISDQGIVAIAGLDRDAICHRLPYLARYSFALASPDAIHEALEAGLRAGSAGRQQVTDILESLFSFADQCGADGITLSFVEHQPVYRLHVLGTPVQQGTIAQSIAGSLKSLCRDISEKDDGIMLPGDRRVSVRAGQGPLSFYLSQLRHETRCEVVATPDPVPLPAAGEELLVIDDNQDFLKVLKRFLQREGYQVRTAGSAAEALWLLEESPRLPFALVSDLHMHAASGMDLMDKLSRMNHLGNIPVLLLTSDDSIESEISALARGAVAYIPKSRDPRVLAAHLERLRTSSIRAAA